VDYWAYCRALVAAAQEAPGDNLPGDMVRMQREGAEISDDEIAGVLYSVLFAGHETTTTLLANAMREVLLNRDRWEELKANPDKWTAATEEFLRFSPSIVAWRRRALADAEIGGVAIPKGADILLLLGSANRDDRVFENPDVLDIDRANARNHLSFGYGIHFCLGQQLSKLEFGIAMRELARRLPSLRLAPEQEFSFARTTSFRIPTALHLEWDI
jgi:cytochrome P450